MEETDRLYRALREGREALALCREAAAMGDGLLRGEDDGFLVTTTRCVLERDWLDAMNAGFPHIERAIEEQRRFLRAHREVVRIDQAKQVTAETIRHLSRHSHYISDVKPDGEVVPRQVLVVERDENFAVYENRFLHTLLARMEDFVETRYGEVKRECGARRLDVRFGGAFSQAGGRAETLLRLEKDAGEEQGPNEALDRLRELRRQIAALKDKPLMRRLKGAPPVRSPIVRNNVMKKNVAFRGALELFEYLESYNRPGFRLIRETPVGRAPLPAFLKGALDAFSAAQLQAMGLCADPAAFETLEERYQEEEKRRAREEEARRQALEEEIARRMQQAREAERLLWQEKTEAVERERDRLENELIKERDALAQCRREAREAKEAFADALLLQRAEHRAQAQCLGGELARAQSGLSDARREAALAAEEASAALTRRQEESARELAQREAQWQRRLTEAAEEAKRLLAQGERELARQRQQGKEETEHRVAEERKKAAEQLKQQREKASADLRALKKSHGREMENALRNADERMRRIKIQQKNNIRA